MELPVDRLVTNDELKIKASRCESIEQLLAEAKQILETNVWNANYPLNAVNATVFLEEAKERLKGIRDDAERQRYGNMIDIAYALRDERFDEIMKSPG